MYIAVLYNVLKISIWIIRLLNITWQYQVFSATSKNISAYASLQITKDSECTLLIKLLCYLLICLKEANINCLPACNEISAGHAMENVMLNLCNPTSQPISKKSGYTPILHIFIFQNIGWVMLHIHHLNCLFPLQKYFLLKGLQHKDSHKYFIESVHTTLLHRTPSCIPFKVA